MNKKKKNEASEHKSNRSMLMMNASSFVDHIKRGSSGNPLIGLPQTFKQFFDDKYVNFW